MFLGRDPVLLRELSSASGMHLIINTGLYAAGERDNIPEPYLPEYAYKLSADQLSGAWIREWFDGIEGTDVRPGFIKIGVNRGKLREISRKIVRAAAKTSRVTGLVIAAHTGDGRGALESLQILAEEEVAPDRYILVHAQSESDFDLHLECARKGAWIEYDGIGPKSSERHLSLVRGMLDAGFEDQVLISQDAGWYRPGEPNGGAIRGFEYLSDEFVPIMLDSGIPQATVDHFLVHNPRRALEVKNL
jgi:phosphotriesterase-related protein